MTDIDVNEAFRSERVSLIESLKTGRDDAMTRAAEYNRKIDDRIASGKLVPIGNDRYRVEDPDSYDNGEVWTYQKRSTEMPALLLPEHGLDETTGKVALYSRVPEWHNAGTIIPAGLSDIDAVLRAGGIDWETQLMPHGYDWQGERRIADGAYDHIRADTGMFLGAVGRVYTPISNRAGAQFLQHLVDDYGVVFESAGATYNGKHVFIGLRLPEDVELDLADGVTDTIRPYLFWRNPHDGTAALSVILTPWRIACGNTERFALRDAKATWTVRHTTNAMDEEHVKEAQRTLGLSMKYFTAFKAEEEQLARNEMLMAEFETFAKELYPVAEDAGNTKKRNADERMGTLTGMFAAEADRLGWRAYAAERVITDFLDHVAPKRGAEDGMAAARATAIIEGGVPDKVKQRAHNLLMNRVK
jgi:phage/plasmid-like protein (TIGR03299 family)